MIERQELYCHECGRYVQFDIDVSLNGNHVLNCPNCGHEHCRVVKNGIITEDRWNSRNPTYNVSTWSMSTSTTSTYDYYSVNTAGTGNSFTYASWMNQTSAGY
jgi:DNA-directed RNA polymerase subunit RPC12/RpoP